MMLIITKYPYIPAAFIMLLFIFSVFMWYIADFARHKRRISSRAKYISEYEGVRSEWEAKHIQRLAGIDYRELWHPSPFQVRKEEHEKTAQNMLIILSGGGIVWLGAIFQGKTEALTSFILVGGGLLIASLLLASFVRASQVKRYYFYAGEWEKNERDFEEGKIDKAELLWRHERSTKAFTNLVHTLSILSLGTCIFGYALVMFGEVGPSGWTGSGDFFDRLAGVLILELHGAAIAES